MAKQISKIGPVESFIQGIMISAIIGVIIFFPLFFIFGGPIGPSIVGGLVAIAFFCSGLPDKAIPTNNVGVIYRWKERVFGKVTSEGLIWTFPWIYSLQPILVVKKPIVIGEDKPFEVSAVKPGTEGNAEGLVLVPITVQVLVRYFIWNAPESMNNEDDAVEKIIVKYVNSSTRYVGTKTGVHEFVKNKKGVADAVFEDFKTTNHESTGEDPRTYNEQIEDMGYRIKDIELVKVDLPEALKNATTAEEVEQAQRTSDKTNIETLIMLTNLVIEAYPGIPYEEALNRVQAERGNLKLSVIKGAEKVLAMTGTNNETIGG